MKPVAPIDGRLLLLQQQKAGNKYRLFIIIN